LPEGTLPLFAAQTLKGDTLNLLQGVYEPRRDMRSELAPWRTATIFIAILFALHLIVTGARWWQLKQQEAKLDQQITETYSQGLPGATLGNTSQARRAFEVRLAALQSGGISNQMFQSLAALSDAIGKTPNSQLEDISYQEGIVNLRLMTPTVATLDQIRRLLASHGLTAEIQSANPRDNRVEGRIQIKPGAR